MGRGGSSHVGEEGGTQPRNVQGGRIIAVGLIAAVGVGAAEPAPPLHCFLALSGGAIGLGGLAAARAGGGGAPGALRTEAQAKQVALVPKQPPDFPPDGPVISGISPAAPD